MNIKFYVKIVSYLFVSLIALFHSTTFAAKIEILASIKPVALIVKDIAGENANVELLLKQNTSPHDYALKPSDMKNLNQADLVVWVGKELELFLAKILEDKENSISLLDAKELKTISFAKKNEHHLHDEHHEHEHSSIDPHIWLGPSQALASAKFIMQSLVKIDPTNQEIYQKNYQNFSHEINNKVSELQKEFSQHKAKPYFLFHDGYGYFEQSFALKAKGHLTINPERRPGAKTLFKIRKQLKNKNASCVFSEPQFNPATVKSLVKGTKAKIVLIDPIGQELILGKHSYVDFFDQLAGSYLDCFVKN